MTKSRGESLFENMCTFEEWKHCSNSRSTTKFGFAKGLAKGKLGGIIDGH